MRFSVEGLPTENSEERFRTSVRVLDELSFRIEEATSTENNEELFWID
nr:MAG TPA: hypothetical protein [Caudoviricetes sp.]